MCVESFLLQWLCSWQVLEGLREEEIVFVLRMGAVRVKLIVRCLEDASSGYMADWIDK